MKTCTPIAQIATGTDSNGESYILAVDIAGLPWLMYLAKRPFQWIPLPTPGER